MLTWSFRLLVIVQKRLDVRINMKNILTNPAIEIQGFMNNSMLQCLNQTNRY